MEVFIQKNEQTKALKKEVWTIGIPAIIESLFTTFAGIIDTKMIAFLGVPAISAVSVTSQPKLFVFSLFFAINVAVSALVAQCVGRKDQKKANQLFVSGFLVALILCVVLSIFCVIFAQPIMEVCSGQKDTMAMSVSYYRIIMGGMVFNILFMFINSVLRGCGYTKITMQSNIVFCLVNILFNYLLIEGHLGFPRLEIAGAAIATVLGTVVAMIMCFIKLWNKEYFVNLQYIFSEKIHFSKDVFRELCGMWGNICAENFLTRLGFLLISMMVARIGSFNVSVHSIGMTLMNISFAFGDGLQSAAVAFVGRSVGEKSIEKVKKYTSMILLCGLKCSIILGVLYIVLGRWYYSIFSKDPQFIQTGMILCIIIAVISPIQVAQIIYNGVLKCMNCTKQTLIATIISVAFLNTGVDYLLCMVLQKGLWGIWTGTFLCQLTRLLILVYLYKKHLAKYKIPEAE